ncbi:hypothetical protein C8J57DRAFT_1538537 [Mycena rebaudengoi]|nr:hypothetical protein C8J57DRAFT_1538537 [Mycena rebaudengoi]
MVAEDVDPKRGAQLSRRGGRLGRAHLRPSTGAPGCRSWLRVNALSISSSAAAGGDGMGKWGMADSCASSHSSLWKTSHDTCGCFAFRNSSRTCRTSLLARLASCYSLSAASSGCSPSLSSSPSPTSSSSTSLPSVDTACALLLGGEASPSPGFVCRASSPPTASFPEGTRELLTEGRTLPLPGLARRVTICPSGCDTTAATPTAASSLPAAGTPILTGAVPRLLGT